MAPGTSAGKSLERGARGIRLAGGVNSDQALLWNAGTCRPDVKGDVQAGDPRKGKSTDAGHRGGAVRSRDEGSVVGLDRRDCGNTAEDRRPTSNGRSRMTKAKRFDIPKREVWEAFKKVKANQGAAGVDGQSIADFEVGSREQTLTSVRTDLTTGRRGQSGSPRPTSRVANPRPALTCGPSPRARASLGECDRALAVHAFEFLAHCSKKSSNRIFAAPLLDSVTRSRSVLRSVQKALAADFVTSVEYRSIGSIGRPSRRLHERPELTMLQREMANSHDSVSQLSDRELLAEVKSTAARERETTARRSHSWHNSTSDGCISARAARRSSRTARGCCTSRSMQLTGGLKRQGLPAGVPAFSTCSTTGR